MKIPCFIAGDFLYISVTQTPGKQAAHLKTLPALITECCPEAVKPGRKRRYLLIGYGLHYDLFAAQIFKSEAALIKKITQIRYK